MTKALVEFVVSLHKNRKDDKHLQKYCHTSIRGDIVTIQIDFQDDGQYGLDIYTRSPVVFILFYFILSFSFDIKQINLDSLQ